MVMCGGVSFSYGRGIRVENRKGLGNSTRYLKDQFSNYGFNHQTQVICPLEKGPYLQDIISGQTQILKISRLGLSVWQTGGAENPFSY